MKNIITIQHPEPIHHTNGMVVSWANWDLTETKTGKNMIRRMSDMSFIK